MDRFPLYRQMDSMDCGPSCLRMIAKYYGCNYSLEVLRKKSYATRNGVSLLGISEAAENIGFKVNGVKVSFDSFVKEQKLPCILHWNRNHFVVCYNIKQTKHLSHNGNYHMYIADPATGKYRMNKNEFLKCWNNNNTNDEKTGIALYLKPEPSFYESKKSVSKEYNLRYYIRYITPHKGKLFQLIIGMLIGSVLQLIFPFLTQTMIDKGIGNRDINFITLILIAQLALFTVQMIIEFVRNWITLHMNTKININLISDFLTKLMKLPLHFFESKNVGDIMQRIGDHSRIESLLTSSSLYTLFSCLNFFVFAIILAYYNLTILAIFFIGNLFYVLSILYFMKFRRELDYKRFAQASIEQSNLVQMITGMQEIKLNNCEQEQRNIWENIQMKLYKINTKGLALSQYQQSVSAFWGQLTNFLISFFAAKLVVEGKITLGMMMSIAYIVGQLSAPIAQLVSLIYSFQDAKLSLERLNEIHNQKDEDMLIHNKINMLSPDKTIRIENLSFSYDGSKRNIVLNNICLEIPQNKVTAIVGASGSGKTSLIKLLMNFYDSYTGDIKIGPHSLRNINPHLWRDKVGCVMQEGFIFSDSILKNIVIKNEEIDPERFEKAISIANIKEFVDTLPMKFDTKIGMEGDGISQGQRQRILIARAIYKEPEFIFFDEATNSLDTNNEYEIVNKLNQFYKGKTVIIVAHRLSTVRNADNIIVFNKGQIVEQGSHEQLLYNHKIYYSLIKNQMQYN